MSAARHATAASERTPSMPQESEQTRVPAPRVDAEFTDNFDPYRFWRIVSIEHDVVHLEALFVDSGRPCDTRMEWPRNRWLALFARGLLTAR